MISALPAEAGGSLGPAAGAGLGAEPGSAGWPASCAGTGAGFSGMQVGSLLVVHKKRTKRNGFREKQSLKTVQMQIHVITGHVSARTDGRKK